MNTNFTNFFYYAAKEPQNTGGGNSRLSLRSEGTRHKALIESCSWSQGTTTLAEQPANRPLITRLSPAYHPLLAVVWKYVACLLIAFFVGVGNVWAADQTFTVEGPAVSKRYMQDKILVSGTVNASKKIANGSNGPVFYLQSGNYAPLQIVSKSANIKKIEIYGNRDTGSNSQATAFNVQTSSDAISFSVPTSGFTATKKDNGDPAALESLSAINMIGNNQTYATTITVTFTSPVMAIRLVGTASVSIKRVVITYDDAITPTPELCEVHMTSTSAATLSGTIGTWTKTNLTSGYTYTDTEATPNNYYFNKSSGTYGYIDLGEGNAFAKGDEIWLEISGGSTLRAPSHAAVTTKLNKQSDSSGDASVQPTCSIAVSMPTYVRYITQEGDPWVGSRYLYIKRGNSDHSVYQVTIHRASGGGDPTPTTYTVTYDGNGKTNGDVPEDDSSYEEGDEVTVLDNTGSLARTGYTFSGWNTEADGTGDSYVADEKFTMGTADVTLYAKWTLNLSTHSAGTYETAVGSGGYGLTLKTYSGRDYEIYTFNTSKLYAGSSETSSDGKEMLTAVANTDVAPSDGWLLVRPNAVNNGGDYNSPDEFAFSSETDNDRKTHYISITNTDYIKLKVSGYDQFSFFGRDNGTGDGKKFVVKIDGAAQTFDPNGTDNTLYRFTISTGEHVIEVTAEGSNVCRFRGFSLRLPEVSCDATVPGDISAGDLTDGEITLTAEGSAETGDTWYWQSASDGTSTSDEYDAENGKTVDEAGTYYLRSYNTAGTCWSTAKSITLTAEDFVAHYAITYNKGAYGSGDAIAAGDKTEDEDFTLSSSMFTRSGYVQVGWATSDGGSKAYDLGGTYSDNAALILYPVWAPKDTYVAAFEYDSESPAAPARWEFSTGNHTSTSNSADYVPTFGSEYPGDGPSNANYIAFAKGGSAYAIYDLGYSTTVSQITATLYGGSSSDVSIDIQYLGADKSTVKNTYTAKAKNWGSSHTDAVSNDVVANVRYIKVKGASKWVVLSAFSVTYGDLTPKYTVTYVPNNGVEPAETMTDSDSPYKAGTEVTLLTNTFTAPATKEFDAWEVTPAAGGDPITITNGKFTMPSANVNVTAQWKTITVKYHVTYNLNGASGDAPTETDKAANDEFTLAAAPSRDGYHFEGWQWTDNLSANHTEDAGGDFTMPAYDVEFTAQWKPYATITFSDGVYILGGGSLNVSANFSSNSQAAAVYSLKENYGENASITGAGLFTATVAGEYVVVANQAGNATYAATSKEATITVLPNELSEIYVWSKAEKYGGNDKCVTADQANVTANANNALTQLEYSSLTMTNATGMGRPGNNTVVTLTFSATQAGFAIKNICAFGKLEEPLGGEIKWGDGSWTALAAYGSGDGEKKTFDAPEGLYPETFSIRFTSASTSTGGIYWRNALVTLEAKKTVASTVVTLDNVKVNGSAISSSDLATLKTAYTVTLAAKYAAAPTVTFVKHTVITYTDESYYATDDNINVTASEVSEKWQAQQEINSITYTVKAGISTSYTVNYVDEDGSTSLGSEVVAVGSHPTASGITATKAWNTFAGWLLSSVLTDLDAVSAAAGATVTLQASYTPAYATSINIEKWVLDNRKNNTAFRAVLDARHYQYANLNDLDSLTTDKNESDRNYPFLGQKIKTTGGYISFLLKAGSELHVKFGNIPAAVNLIVNDGEPVAKSASFDYTAGGSDEIIKLATTTDGTVVFKQIMIDEAIETVVLPAVVTYDANGGSFGKSSEKYTGTPLVIGDATPASEDYLFDGWHLGTVDGAAIDATGYEPTKNVTLVAKYVLKPSPFSLSALTYKIGSGDAVNVGYEEGTYEYTIKLPYASSYDAITVAATLSDGTSSLKAAISQPATVPGDASFTVVADDESEQEYVIHFVKDAKDGLEIIGAVVTGNTTATVTGVYKGDASVKLNSKKIDNGDYYIYVTLKDGYTFEETDVLVVDVNTKSDIGTKALEITTGVGDISGDVWKTIALDDYSTGENIIALTGIAANQTSIGLKRSANINAKINGLKVLRPMNPVLKTVTVAGVEGEPVADVVTIEVPFSTSDAALSSVAIDWVSNSDAWTAAHDPAVADAWAWGVENTVTFTDKDGDESVYYVTVNKAAASSDATLSALSYGDPATAIALQDGVYEYNVILPYGTAVVPALAATKNHVGAAEPVIADASVFANRRAASTVTVTAEDNSTVQVYTVNFEVSRYQEIMLWDGSTMSNVMTNGSASLKGVTWEATGVNVTSFSAKTCAENSKSYTSALDFGGVTGTSRQFSITIPNGYLAKLSLVYRAKDTDERYLMISSALAGTVNENTIGSVKAQGNSSDLFVVTFDQLVTGKVYINTTQGFHVHEIRIMMTPGHGRSITPGTYGTICVDHNVAFEDIQGVTVYELMGREPVYRKLAFDEIVSGELEAGAPYVFQATGDRMIMLYGETKVNAPVDKHNGMYGTFEQVVLTELNDVYYFAQRALWSCDGALDLTIPANRAYVKLSEIGDVADPNPAPGRRRVTMDVNGEKIATGVDEITNDQSPMTNKVIIDGRLFILRGEKMYDATGRLVK